MITTPALPYISDYIAKDYDWIKSKKEIVKSEIALARHPNTKRMQILGLGMTKKPLEFLHWKLYHLSWIHISPVKDLLTKFDHHYEHLCNDCKENVKMQDMPCSKDFKRFILCLYISKAIVNFWGYR